MPIEVSCTNCGRRHSAPDQLAGRQAKCGCGAVLSIPPPATAPAVPQFVSFGMQAYEDAKRQQAARDAEQAASLPSAVRMVLGGTLAAGGMSLLATLLFLLVTMAVAAGDQPAELLKVAIMFVLCGILTALNFTEASLVYARIPVARPLGYVVAVVNLCGGPVHWGCAVLCFIGLNSAEMTKHLSGRR